MTRWPFLSRLLGAPARRRGNRFAPRLEVLEARETPAVDVTFKGLVPSFNEDKPFQFDTAAFFAIDNPDDPSGVIRHTATIVAQNGVLNVTAGTGLSVTGSGTDTVTVVGTRDAITLLFLGANGTVEFAPTAFFSGNGRVTVSATDGTTSDSEFTFLKVQPVLSQSIGQQFFDFFGERFLTPVGFDDFEQVPVPNFGALVDPDGSELVGFFFSLFGPNESFVPEFTLLSNGSPYPTAGSPNSWFIRSNSSDALRKVIDSFELVPPPGFSGRVGVKVGAFHDDIAFFADGGNGFDRRPVLSGALFLRFFQEPQVAAAPALVPEGGTIDLAGRFSVFDPSAEFGDAHTFRVTALSGTLDFDESNPFLSDLEVSATATEVVLTGDLSTLQAALDTPGVITFTAGSEFFSGVLPLEVGFVNRPGDQFRDGPLFGPLPFAPLAFDDIVPMGFAPVAAPLDPVVADASGNAGALVPLDIALPPVADTDGSETVTVFVTGVPDGALLSAGTNLGGGMWVLDPAQLAGLSFAAPTGGTFSMTVFAIVRDVAVPLGLVDEAVSAASFTVVLDDSTSFGDFEDEGADAEFDSETGSELDEGTSEFVDNDDFDADFEDEGIVVAPASIGAFNLVEVPTNLRDAQTPTDDGASPGGSREAALTPIYGDGEKHPLPPVLPLDQSLPVAGFSDSGGDSFALLDRLYRGEFGAAPVAADVPAPPVELAEAPPPREVVAGTALAPAAGADPVAAPVDVDAGTDWRVWAAVGAVAGAAAAGAVYARTRRTKAETTARAARARLKPLERTA
jgi:hypothetical protein